MGKGEEILAFLYPSEGLGVYDLWQGRRGGGGRPSCWGVIFKIVIGFGELCSDKGSLHGNFFQLVQKQ